MTILTVFVLMVLSFLIGVVTEQIRATPATPEHKHNWYDFGDGVHRSHQDDALAVLYCDCGAVRVVDVSDPTEKAKGK